MYPVPAVSRRDEFLTILQLAEDANLLKDVATAAFIPNPA